MNIKVHEIKRILGDSRVDYLAKSVNYDTDSKQIISFCLVQTHTRGDRTYEIIKYDSSHGHCHVHKYYEDLSDPGQPLLDNPINANSILEFKNDIKQNWKEYLYRYCRKHFKPML